MSGNLEMIEKDWKARYEAAQEQIRRLRESLAWCLINVEATATKCGAFREARAILKETAPNA